MPDLATRADVARLFGRAAFGATAADLTKWENHEYTEVVDSLFPPGPPPLTLGRTPQADEALRPYVTELNNAEYAGRWWLERMRTTPYPLEERMTLFWHDHFATAVTGEPDTGMVMTQNDTLRTYALGNFRDFANAMTVDPAMLMWLSGIANHVGGVNENYAREFFELFTLGVAPQAYTETDIREAAKAFTGWLSNTTTRMSQFEPTRHDKTVKTVLGRSIGGYPVGDPLEATEYKEVTEAALAHNGGKTTSRFLAYKLVLEFGYQPNEADITADAVIEDVAAAIRAGDAWNLRAGVRTMLLHPGWRNAPLSAGSDLVRSPIEIVVHAAKVTGLPLDFHGGSTQPQNVFLQMYFTGEVPLLPPNVGGWPNGRGWLSQTTALARYNLLSTMAQCMRNELRDTLTPWPASGDVSGWTAYMGLAGLSPNTTLRVQDLLADPGTTVEVEKQMSMFILVGASPDWQVM